MIRLALTDLDATLVPYGGVASPRAVAAIRAANAAPGLTAGPITGRTAAMLGWMFGTATDCWDTGVLVNGQVVRLHGRTLLCKAPSNEQLEALAAFVRERGGEGCALTVYDDAVDANEVCVGITAEEMARHPKPFASFTRCSPHVPGGLYVKNNIHCALPRGEAERLRDACAVAFPELDFVFPSPKSSTIDITPAGVTKLTGLMLLMEELDVSLDEVCAFGDGENDLPVIEAVPNSVAVSNACEAVAGAARWHIGSCESGAVADAYLELARAARDGDVPAFMR